MWKIQIDLKKLINSENKGMKNEAINKDAYLIIEQLHQYINNGNNSCFLVSGYRGTGKTTIIENLEKNMINDNALFIKLNISKYEKHCYIMRKLIREIYRVYIHKNAYENFKIAKIFDKEYLKLYKNKKKPRKKKLILEKELNCYMIEHSMK